MHSEDMEKKCIGNSKEAGDFILLDLNFEIFQKREVYKAPFNKDINVGGYAIVETARGIEAAKINSFKNIVVAKDICKSPNIIRIATPEDIAKYNLLREEAIKAGFIFKNKQAKYSLGLKHVSTEFTFDKKKLIFYFASEERVDFRELVKDLASVFKVRIELRQIGVRDHAKFVGNCGGCGKQLCCKSIVSKFDTVSIKMARDQSVSVTPSKISGICGRLKCCMSFEHEQYSEKQDLFPIVGQMVKTPEGTGNVVSLNILNDYLFVSIPSKGINKFDLSEINFNKEEKKVLEKEIEKKTEETFKNKE